MCSRVLLSKTVYLTLSVVLPGKKICRLLTVARFSSLQSDFRMFKLKSWILALAVPATRTAYRQFLGLSLFVCTLFDQAVQGCRWRTCSCLVSYWDGTTKVEAGRVRTACAQAQRKLTSQLKKQTEDLWLADILHMG